MTAVIRVAVLLTCFNRQQKTLRCLQQLASQLQCAINTSAQPPAMASAQLTVYLLDNGNDGTFETVSAQYPWVRLSRGHAGLYWNSGMLRVWQQAVHEGAQAISPETANHHKPSQPSKTMAEAVGEPYDFYLWLNDDVSLAPDAIRRLLQSYFTLTPNAGALIGTMANAMSPAEALHPSYGGRRRVSWCNPLAFGPVMMPTAEAQPCVFINGNLCLVPKAAVAQIGLLSAQFSHGLGDFDYGLRLQQAGFTTYVAPGFYGECALNPKTGSIFDPQVPFSQRVAMLQRPNVLPPATEWRYFVRQHGGWLWPLFWLKSWGRQLFPSWWLRLRQRRVSL